MDLNRIERVDVNSLGGNDALTVDDLSSTDVREVNHDEAAALGGKAPDTGNDQTIVNGTYAGEAITAAGGGGRATVTGLAAAVNIGGAEGTRDTLTINALGGNDRIDATGLGADTLRLTADGGAGNDTLAGAPGADTESGGDGNDTIDGNGGADVANLGAGDDRFVWDPGDGSDVVEGGAGHDAMTFNGAPGDEQFTVSANGPRVRFFRNVGNITMDLDDVEQIDTNALGGADQLTVNDVTGTDLTGVKADLAGAAGGTGGDNAKDVVTVNGTSGSDAIKAAGSAGSASVTGLTARVDIVHAETALDDLAINGLAGNDKIDASGLAANAIHQLTANGGDGNDTVTGGAGADVLLGEAGDDVLTGGPGVDTLDGGAGNNTLVQD